MNYIVIDCRYSNLEWIKEHILKSRLNEIFDLSNINWNYLYEKSMHTRVKESSSLWNDGWTVLEIANKYKLCTETIRKYLKKATELNWCVYDSKYSFKNRRKKQ